MKTYILAALAVVLVLAGLAFMGNAQADTDPWASVIEKHQRPAGLRADLA